MRPVRVHRAQRECAPYAHSLNYLKGNEGAVKFSGRFAPDPKHWCATELGGDLRILGGEFPVRHLDMFQVAYEYVKHIKRKIISCIVT